MGGVSAQVLPSGFEAYHDYAEMNAEIAQAVADHPAILQRRVIRTSFQGRADRRPQDQRQRRRRGGRARGPVHRLPARSRGAHGRDGASDPAAVHRRLRDRPADHPGGEQPGHLDRPQRQPRRHGVRQDGQRVPLVAQEPSAQRRVQRVVGTDLNRNWDFQWGCCGGSSGTTSSETYRGPSPASAPEVQTVANFVSSRVIGGRQRITATSTGTATASWCSGPTATRSRTPRRG